MNKKKGFTLIELLAVIVVLAVIALIATPIILNMIDDANDGAIKNTARHLLNIAETEYGKESLKNQNPTIDFASLEYKGEKLDSITGLFDQDGKGSIAIYKGKKCAYKTPSMKDIVLVKDITLEECNELVSIYTSGSCFFYRNDSR